MAYAILVVDVDKTVRSLIKNILRGQDFSVYEAITCKRLMEIVTNNDLDLIMIDPVMRDGNGLDFIMAVRACTRAPIILCAEDITIRDKEKAFERGADYFIKKPFDSQELLMAIKSSVRRYRDLSLHKSSSELPVRIKFGPWVLDRARFQIYDEQNREAPLTFQEYQLLETLAMASNRVLTREELIHVVRNEDENVCERSIDVKITRIRKKIGDNADSPEIIKTVRGAGYMLACRTEILESD